MDERFRALRIIWLALAGGVVSFTAVSFSLVVLGIMDEGMLPPSVLPLVAAVAMVLMAAGMLLRRRMVEAIPRGAAPRSASRSIRSR